MDLTAHLLRQRAFSRATFGPNDRILGVCKHLRKEIREVRKVHAALIEAAESGADREVIDALGFELRMEITDMILLALDAAWRAGELCEVLGGREISVAEIPLLIDHKESINERRDWPDWRSLPTDCAIEHQAGEDDPEKDGPRAELIADLAERMAESFDDLDPEEAQIAAETAVGMIEEPEERGVLRTGAEVEAETDPNATTYRRAMGLALATADSIAEGREPAQAAQHMVSAMRREGLLAGAAEGSEPCLLWDSARKRWRRANGQTSAQLGRAGVVPLARALDVCLDCYAGGADDTPALLPVRVEDIMTLETRFNESDAPAVDYAQAA